MLLLSFFLAQTAGYLVSGGRNITVWCLLLVTWQFQILKPL